MELKTVKNTYQKALDLKRRAFRPKCAAIIVAAGSATRMGGIDKVMTKLGAKPVVVRSVRAFQDNELVDEILVVTRRELLEEVSRHVSPYDKVKAVVVGGETRTQSVQNGLDAVSEGMTLIAVHDGARPLITQEVITKTVAKAAQYGAAAPAVPVKDTIKVATSGTVDETPDRKSLYAIQTPQVFDADLLRGALQNAAENEIAITDDCSAVEAIGMKIHLTDGDEENLKITTPLDLELAQMIWEKRQRL